MRDIKNTWLVSFCAVRCRQCRVSVALATLVEGAGPRGQGAMGRVHPCVGREFGSRALRSDSHWIRPVYPGPRMRRRSHWVQHCTNRNVDWGLLPATSLSMPGPLIPAPFVPVRQSRWPTDGGWDGDRTTSQRRQSGITASDPRLCCRGGQGGEKVAGHKIPLRC